MSPVKVGVVGCGNISSAYLRTLQAFPATKCIALADMDLDRARAKAEEFGIKRACSVDEIMADPEVELIVNLTPPDGHYSVASQTIAAGKHVYNEKPLCIEVAQAEKLLAEAKARGVRVGCAPGTFLGAGLQTCRELIDDGVIGAPVAALATMLSHGVEHWHPNPEFYYKPGGGPMLDMGPYYLTALVSLIGGIKSVMGATAITQPTRLITSKPFEGQTITVETPDHVAGLINFAGGAVGTIVTSFAVWNAYRKPIQIYGSKGTLYVPDPNSLGGPVQYQIGRDGDLVDVPVKRAHAEGRGKWGIGVVDMAYAIRSGRPHRASGDLALQVLKAMHGFLASAEQGKAIEVGGTTTDRPAPVPADVKEDTLDE